ncbi:hypothetical protein [Burkholderia anthina]|uniref:hypothetical protein n=1 Tax=Burkholderia anthina TaxID=179879 RepID=UPI001FC862AF|nr:hypothetical protein [Burkholderia anthina]
MDAAAKHENRYRAVIEYANGAMFNVAELDAWAVSNKVPVSFEKLLKDEHISENYSANNHFVHFEVLSITLANRLVPPEMDPGEASIQLLAAGDTAEYEDPLRRLRHLVMVRYDRQLLSAVFDGDLFLYDTLTMSRIDMGAARMRYNAEPEAYLHTAQARLIDTAQGMVTAADIEQARKTLELKFAQLDHLAWAMVILSADVPPSGEDRYRQILSATRWLQSLGLPFRHSNGLPASQPKGVPVVGMDVREYQYLAVADVREAAIAGKCWPALATANRVTPEMTVPDFDEHWTIAEAAKIIGTDEAGIYERFLDGRLRASVFFAKEAPAQLVKTSNSLWLTDRGDVKASVANELRRVRYVWDLTLYDDKKLYHANLWVVRCRYFGLKHGTTVDAPEAQFGIFIQRDDEIYRLMQSQPVNGEVPPAQDLPDGAVLVVRKSEIVGTGATDDANPITDDGPHKPDWDVWRDALKVTLRDAVCLSCGTNPMAVPKDWGEVFAAELLPQFSASKKVRNEISRRLQIAKTHAGTGGTLPTVTGDKGDEVYLTAFAEWAANTMEWSVPDEMRALAGNSIASQSAASPEMQSTSSSEPRTNGKSVRTNGENWQERARELAQEIGLKKWNSGIRNISAREVAPSVATELGKERKYWGKQGARSESNVRNEALRGWTFQPPDSLA